MCGIAGIVALDAGPVDPAPVRRMLDRLVHRGPDSSGVLESSGVCAGIRRLRVIDLETGDQPIGNEDDSVRVVFNGEIYNHEELRADLVRRGHRLKTTSDTEVLVHLWEDHGPAMLDRLNGMFAFCLVDAARREVFVARDRFGVKPLYWAREGRRIVFASEPRALEAGLAVRPALDARRLVDLFFLQYVPGEETIRRGVVSLLPGHAMHVRDGALDISRWYEVPPATGEGPRDEREEAEALRDLLTDAVRLQRVADVPVGAFLSGGIDSTVVSTILAEQGGRLATFSIGFEEASHDERTWARRVAERLGAEHHELVLSAADLGASLPGIARTLGDPVTDPALVPTWLLSRFAREKVTVVLTGEGADEIFGGYRRHALQARLGALRVVPGLGAAARAGGKAGWLPGRSAQALEALATRSPAANYLRWAATLSPTIAAELFETDLLDEWLVESEQRFAGHFEGSRRPLDARLRADLAEWLPNNLLAKVDRASMAFSLEARVPFLDHRIVERAMALPDAMKVSGGGTKRVLRRAFRDRIPAEVLRRPKRGFDLPLAEWMRGPLREPARARFEGGALDRWTLLKKGAASRLLDRHLAGRPGLALPLFLLFSVAEFLDSDD